MMSSTHLDDAIDTHKGKVAIVFAHGPSAKEHLKDLSVYNEHKDSYCFIGMGDTDWMQDNLKVSFNLDYWVMANSEMTVGNSYERFNKFPNTTLVWADTADRTPYTITWANLKVPSIAYDQRHFDNKECPNCKIPLMSPQGVIWMSVACRVIPGRLTIQEQVQRYTKHNTHYGTGSSVALHAVALGILVGCKEIRIYGVDLDYGKGYVDGKTTTRGATFDDAIMEIVNDFNVLDKSANNIGVKLINYSKDSPIREVVWTKA